MIDHDVLIIGSGASGGMTARELTRRGIKCLMLDAGPATDFDRDRGTKKVYELPYKGFGQPGRFPHVTQANEFNANVWADEKQNPYTYDPQVLIIGCVSGESAEKRWYGDVHRGG